ncbi:MAG: PatB family C-S lyase [Bacteroidaceae bacterium]|nr:PatB family C-S lyase [Bacteroidaceae bacterium]
MKYNFDELVPRENTDCFKYEGLMDLCGRTDVLPMWVADMDFRTPPFVTDAIARRLQQGILGYTCGMLSYRESICRWVKRLHNMDVTPDMVSYVPGVVSGIFLAIQTFTEKGDKVLIQQPVYHPFRLVPEATQRVVVQNKLLRTADSFDMDFEALERDIQGCKLMILCNPHNPAGICWSRETLQRVAAICARAGVIVVSDEIHCDMVLPGHRHIPFATVSDEARRISITLQAPSKTFNMPGIVCSHAIVFNEALRKAYFSYIEGTDQDLGNVFAYDCARACYTDEGNEWRLQMLDYVQGNIDYLAGALSERCPKIRMIRPEASFLVFLDCRELGLPHAALEDFFINKARLALNSGTMFGTLGEGYMRMNVGCPRSTVEQAVNQLSKAFQSIDTNM